MRTRALGSVAALLLALVSSGSPARAEVSAEVDVFGSYVRMVVSSDPTAGPTVWRVTKPKPNLIPLNPNGQANGDLYPAIRESNDALRTPWVVWSRVGGGSYDLAFSRWNHDDGEWSPIEGVAPFATAGNDIGPALAFDIDHRPFLVWSRAEGGISRVYLSLWLETRWMPEYRVSDVGQNAVASSIRLLPDRRIEVRYDTAIGRVTRIITFDRPWTINDDVTPMGRFRIDETSIAPAFQR